MTLLDDLTHVLQSPPPAFSMDDIKALLGRTYGITADLRPLASERDQNLRVKADDSTRYLLRISNMAEDPGITNFQTRAFQHVARRDPGIAVSRVIPTLGGASEESVRAADGATHLVRLFSWIEGIALSDFKLEDRPHNAGKMGDWLARLALALADFSHPSEDYALLYDPKHSGHLAAFMDYIEDAGLLALISEQMAQYNSRVVPAMQDLPVQVIFNDMSPRNCIVDPDNPAQFNGFIDFGDMVKTVRIADLAVACLYWVRDTDDPIAHVVAFLAGYHARSPLQLAELAILLDLMQTRAMILILIYHWRARMFPENKANIMQNMPQAIRSLGQLRAIDKQAALARFKRACPQ